MKKTIVTSSIPYLWPKEGNLVFLGEWCKSYSNQNLLQKYEYETMEYHWNNRGKFENDCKDLDLVYEEYLELITHILNKQLKCNYSKRYWRILIGWWLKTFIQVVFDRWYCIREVIFNHPEAEFIRIEPSLKLVKSKNTAESIWRASNDNFWNEQLSADLFELCSTGQKIFTIARIEPIEDFSEKLSVKSIKMAIIKFAMILLGTLFKSKIFTISLESTYLGKFNRIKLFTYLKSFPNKFISWETKDVEIESNSRSWEFPINEKKEFFRILEIMIPKYFPTCFLEDFKNNEQKAKRVFKYFSPKTIITANDFAENESWKYWAAYCVEKGAKLFIAQHGGTYGVAKYLSVQEHEIAISDTYLTWGWQDDSNAKVKPAPAMKLISLKKDMTKDPNNYLMVTTVMPQRSYHLGSWPIGPQSKESIESNFLFVNNLETEVLSKLVVRLSPQDYDWEQMKRWQDYDEKIKTSIKTGELDNLLDTTKLFIGTYNSTTFLEAFRRNIPTILFWNPEHWPLNESSEKYFEILKSVNILFYCPVKAANHFNKIWQDPGKWWDSYKVKNAVHIFSQRYAFVGEKPILNLARIIQNP